MLHQRIYKRKNRCASKELCITRIPSARLFYVAENGSKREKQVCKVFLKKLQNNIKKRKKHLAKLDAFSGVGNRT